MSVGNSIHCAGQERSRTFAQLHPRAWLHGVAGSERRWDGFFGKIQATASKRSKMTDFYKDGVVTHEEREPTQKRKMDGSLASEANSWGRMVSV